MKSAVAACTVSMLLVPGAAHACHVDNFNFVWGSDTETRMTLQGTESCRFGFKASSRSAVRGVAVVRPPQHGSISQVDPSHWTYKPSRGFQGTDQMIVKVTGQRMTGKRVYQGDTNITYAVDVSN